jgi:hypothetical protein
MRPTSMAAMSCTAHLLRALLGGRGQVKEVARSPTCLDHNHPGMNQGPGNLPTSSLAYLATPKPFVFAKLFRRQQVQFLSSYLSTQFSDLHGTLLKIIE